MTANMIYIVALGDGLKCLHKVHLNTQCWRAVICDLSPPRGIFLDQGAHD